MKIITCLDCYLVTLLMGNTDAPSSCFRLLGDMDALGCSKKIRVGFQVVCIDSEGKKRNGDPKTHVKKIFEYTVLLNGWVHQNSRPKLPYMQNLATAVMVSVSMRRMLQFVRLCYLPGEKLFEWHSQHNPNKELNPQKTRKIRLMCCLLHNESVCCQAKNVDSIKRSVI